MNNPLPKLADNIELKSTEDLIPYSKNARTHCENQVAQIASSIIEFGFTNPILIDGDKGIIADKNCSISSDHLSSKSRRLFS